MKRIILLLLCTIFILSLTACSKNNRIFGEAFSNDKKNVVEEIYEETDGGTFVTKLKYDNQIYILKENKIINIDAGENDIPLSWSGDRFFYAEVYYSDKLENPLFMYSYYDRWFYLREDYNYMEDTFIFEGMDFEVKITDLILDELNEQEKIDYNDTVRVVLKSKTDSRLEYVLRVYQKNGEWVAFNGTQYSKWNASTDKAYATDRKEFKLSKEIVEILKDNKFI